MSTVGSETGTETETKTESGSESESETGRSVACEGSVTSSFQIEELPRPPNGSPPFTKWPVSIPKKKKTESADRATFQLPIPTRPGSSLSSSLPPPHTPRFRHHPSPLHTPVSMSVRQPWLIPKFDCSPWACPSPRHLLRPRPRPTTRPVSGRLSIPTVSARGAKTVTRVKLSDLPQGLVVGSPLGELEEPDITPKPRARSRKLTTAKKKGAAADSARPDGPPTSGPLPAHPPDSSIYPTVVQQARDYMNQYPNCVVLIRVGSFYEVGICCDHTSESATPTNLTPIILPTV